MLDVLVHGPGRGALRIVRVMARAEQVQPPVEDAAESHDLVEEAAGLAAVDDQIGNPCDERNGCHEQVAQPLEQHLGLEHDQVADHAPAPFGDPIRGGLRVASGGNRLRFVGHDFIVPPTARELVLSAFAMIVVCLDLEGVLVPEIWINVAERTGIAELRRTTRDEPDYDKLMRGRLEILKREGLGIGDIQDVIGGLEPLEGASEFLAGQRERRQVLILSDTFYQFAAPLMRKLGQPTLFCHDLEIEPGGRISDYHLRMPDQKRASVRALRQIAFRVVAAGDSYNDTTMLAEAHAGILFRPPDNVIREFPQYPVTRTYAELDAAIEAAERPAGG